MSPVVTVVPAVSRFVARVQWRLAARMVVTVEKVATSGLWPIATWRHCLHFGTIRIAAGKMASTEKAKISTVDEEKI